MENSGVIMIGAISTPLQQVALKQVRSMGLYGYSINGKIYGLKKPTRNISVSYSKTFGFSIGGSCSSEDLCIGKEVIYGISAPLSPDSRTDFREKSGIYLEDPISKVLKAGGVLTNAVSVRQTVEDMLQISTVVAQDLDGVERMTWPAKIFPDLNSVAASQLNLEKIEVTEKFPAILQQEITELKQPELLAQEKRTKSFTDQVNAQAPLWNSFKAQNYIQSICDKIIASEALPARCRIFADMFPYAFSYPGGDVFVTAGLLAAVEDESVIAFFLAHELTHVYARHFSKTIAKKDFETNFFNSVSLLSSILSVRSFKLHFVQTFGTQVLTKSLPEVYAAMMTNYTIDQELQADNIAFTVTQELGYSASQIIAGLEKLSAVLENYYNDESKPHAKLSSRFGKFQNRIESLKKRSSESVALKDNSLEFVEIQAKLQEAYDFVRYKILSK